MLLDFADKIGLDQRWLQDKKSGVHFDVTDGKRWQAIKAGAVVIECASPEWMRVVAVARQQYSGLNRQLQRPMIWPLRKVTGDEQD